MALGTLRYGRNRFITVNTSDARQVKFLFGRHKGQYVLSHPDYARWMLQELDPELPSDVKAFLFEVVHGEASSPGPTAATEGPEAAPNSTMLSALMALSKSMALARKKRRQSKVVSSISKKRKDEALW